MTNRTDIIHNADLPARVRGQESTVEANSRRAIAKPRGASNVLLALVLAGAAYTYFVYVKTGPQSASAASMIDTSTSTFAVRSFVASTPVNNRGMEPLLKSSKKAIAQLSACQNVRQVPLADLRTNPFDRSDGSASRSQTGVANKAQSDQQRSAALRRVQSLQLQSVWIDDKNRSCVINNAILMEGQQVDQFTVESISVGAVVVRTGAFRFELRVQK